jgi:hypothetical protein
MHWGAREHPAPCVGATSMSIVLSMTDNLLTLRVNDDGAALSSGAKPAVAGAVPARPASGSHGGFRLAALTRPGARLAGSWTSLLARSSR